MMDILSAICSENEPEIFLQNMKCLPLLQVKQNPSTQYHFHVQSAFHAIKLCSPYHPVRRDQGLECSVLTYQCHTGQVVSALDICQYMYISCAFDQPRFLDNLCNLHALLSTRQENYSYLGRYYSLVFETSPQYNTCMLICAFCKNINYTEKEILFISRLSRAIYKPYMLSSQHVIFRKILIHDFHLLM